MRLSLGLTVVPDMLARLAPPRVIRLRQAQLNHCVSNGLGPTFEADIQGTACRTAGLRKLSNTLYFKTLRYRLIQNLVGRIYVGALHL